MLPMDDSGTTILIIAKVLQRARNSLLSSEAPLITPHTLPLPQGHLPACDPTILRFQGQAMLRVAS